MSLLKHKPNFNIKEALSLTKKIYGISGTAEILAGERDQNFLISTKSGEKWALFFFEFAKNSYHDPYSEVQQDKAGKNKDRKFYRIK